MSKKLIMITLFVLTILSLASVQAQDTVIVKMKYPTDVWVYNSDTQLAVESYVYTNADLDASTITFSPNRNLVTIDSLVWSDTMTALMSGKMFSTSYVRNDTIIQSKIYTFATAGFIVDFIQNLDGTVIAAGTDTIQFATIYMTLKADSIPAYEYQEIDFFLDSTFIPPTTDFIFWLHRDGSAITPEYITDTISLVYTDCIDTDQDGYGNPDIATNTCPDDNCPYTYNPDQADANGNGIGDVCEFVCGDANGDGRINLVDVVHIINYVFRGGTPPDPLESGNANCDDEVNIADAVYTIGYIFSGGTAPCDCK